MHDAFTRYDALKLLALVAMTVDHLGMFLFPELLWLRVVGRVAAPIFCFLIGWNGSYRFRRELLLAAILVSLLMSFSHGLFPLNILWTILLGRMLLARLDASPRKESPVMVVVTALLCSMSVVLFDYGTLGILWMLWGRAVRRAPGSTESWIYALACLTGAKAYGFGLMGYTQTAQHVAEFVIFLVLIPIFQRFALHPMHTPPAAVTWLARHTLRYYVLHLALLVVIGIEVGAITPMFRWVG
jgi:hypothetical protein